MDIEELSEKEKLLENIRQARLEMHHWSPEKRAAYRYAVSSGEIVNEKGCYCINCREQYQDN